MKSKEVKLYNLSFKKTKEDKMEVSRLSNDLKYVEINGVTINLEERSRIDLACMQLDSDVNQGSIYFWGKIRGK